MDKNKPVLVTGASGYIGSRLIPALLHKNYRVRAMTRSASGIFCKSWSQHPGLETVEADMLDAGSLVGALDGCGAAYYLVHSMSSRVDDFASADRRAAENMARVSQLQGLERIIYLSGLGEDDPGLSKHLRSRAEVAKILRQGIVPVTVLRSAVILGSGSASFELIRFLTERMPVMLTPVWVRTMSQPIAASNVLEYLVGCLEKPQTAGETYDIGGPEVLSYQELFRIYAQVTGLSRRVVLRVPFLSPGLLARCAEMITPVPARLSKPLIESMRNTVVCRENRIRDVIPTNLLTCRQAMARSMQVLCRDRIQEPWMADGRPNPAEWFSCGDIYYARGSILELSCGAALKGRAVDFWPLVEGIGGSRGWYGTDLLWQMRGWLDRLAGGYGLQRGRRDHSGLVLGDMVDFWRVLEVRPLVSLLLLAELQMPGEAMLEFRLREMPGSRLEVEITVRFLPKGLGGLMYWYLSYRIHVLVIRTMLANMVRSSKMTLISGPRIFFR